MFKLNYIISLIINHLRISETAYIYNLIWHLSFAHDSTGNTIFLSSLTIQVSSFLSWYSVFFLIRPSNKLETHYLLLKVTQARYLFS